MEAHLHPSITSRQIQAAGLSVHILECGNPDHELVVLLHGFPELAFSWRKVLPLLADAGFYVVAPDVRGYGKTVSMGSNPDAKSTLHYEDGVDGFGMVDLVSELVALVCALRSRPVVKCIIGHDMGSSIAANAALMRPDIFKSLVMMSAPYTGPPQLPSDTPDPAAEAKKAAIARLSSLDPPRKHYQKYFCEAGANDDWMSSTQGLRDLYRGYYYFKSGLHPENKPYSLGTSWDAERISQMPEYYIMKLHSTMSQTVAEHVPEAQSVMDRMSWMSEPEVSIYVSEFARTGFQGGLNHYRARLQGLDTTQLTPFAGRVIQVPTRFVSGASDWGNYQDPGGLEKMQSESVVKAGYYKGTTFIEGAGHWVQQEQPEKLVKVILAFLDDV